MTFPGLKPKAKVIMTNEVPHIVVAKQTQHVGAMMGHVSNGGGQIAIGDKYALRFIRDGSQFVKLELIQYAAQAQATTQTWSKTKKVVAKPKPKKKLDIKITEKKVEELF